MGTKVETLEGLRVGGRMKAYLFFGDELHVGVDRDEEHKSILDSSGRPVTEVLVAGRLSIFVNSVTIGGAGSRGLEIEERDAAQVLEFITKFPDIGSAVVRALGS